MSYWTSTRWDAPHFEYAIPATSGVYVVYLDGELAYIGSSENMRRRLDEHGITIRGYTAWIRTPWGRALNVVIKTRSCKRYGDWLAIEARLIRRISPRGNVRHNSKGQRKRAVGVG